MKRATLVLVLVHCSACCLGIYKSIQLSASGDCPATRNGQCVTVEGFFVIDPEKGPTTEEGYEGLYPFTRFAFSVEPGAKSKFEAALVIVNYGNNGPQKANRVVLAESGEQPHFISTTTESGRSASMTVYEYED